MSYLKNISWLKSILGLLAIIVGSISAQNIYAHGGGGDIALFTTAGQVDIGFAVLDDDDLEQIFFDPNDSVFQSILLPNTPNPIVPWEYSSPEPGFDANEGALPNSAVITINMLNLSYWDGTGGPAFSAAAGIAGGFAPNVHASSADGGFHSHPHFGVIDDGNPVVDGVYLGELSISVAGLTDSDSFFQVALLDSSVTTVEDAEAIGELVRTYLDDPINNPAPIYNTVDYTYYANAISYVESQIPEPTTLAMTSLGILALLARRPRRQG